MRRTLALLLAVTLAVLCCATPAVAAKRVALVIGIDAYDNLPALQKAVNDEKSVAAALSGLGFDVVVGENLTRREMNAKLAELDAKIAPGDTVFFYFAGHGVALGAENYLLPRDLPKPRDGEENMVRDEGHAVDAIVRRVQGRGAAVSFFVLDACRDNPIAATGVRSIGGTRGLTRVDTPNGVFVLFSAGLGQTALDRLSDEDPDPNSVFTRKLVPLLKTPGLSQVALAKRVQREVDALASSVRHPQQPAYYDQIIGEIELSPAAKTGGSSTAPTSAAEASLLVPVPQAAPHQVATVTPPVPFTPSMPVEPAMVAVPKPEVPPQYKSGDTFKDCDACPEMVVIPSGQYVMGSAESEKGRGPNEGPQHSVSIPRAFGIGKFEVTFDEWDACAADGGCNFYFPSSDGWGRGRQPVINVSWNEAQAYINWLSAKSGENYRFATEAEWEYVARAGTSTPFSTGPTISADQANFGRERAIKVGSFSSNQLGVHDMHGNVWEWVGDCWHDSYRGAPTDGAFWLRDGDCARRVLRGGTWGSSHSNVRSAYRLSGGVDRRSGGLRVARTL